MILLLTVISLFILMLSIPVFFGNLLSRIAQVQQKDYMRERIFADRRNLRLTLPEYLAALAFLAYLLPAFIDLAPAQDDNLSLNFGIISVLILMIAAGSLALNLVKGRWKRPRITLRSSLILLICLGLTVISTLILLNLILGLLFSTVLAIWIVLLANEASRRVVFIGHRRQMAKARDQLAAIPGLTAIGITGSYGKSTIKLFLNTLLSSKYAVISTPGSINTDIGLAKSINTQLAQLNAEQKQQLQFAVLEMDAYVIGTIARVTKYFPLDWAILSALNEQHLETFGGKMENTLEGNYQIFQGLKSNGPRTGIFNADNDYALQLQRRFASEIQSGQSYLYGQHNLAAPLDVGYANIKEIHRPGVAGINFQLYFSERLGAEIIEINLPVPGKFNASNFAGAALLAKLAGLTGAEIQAASQKVGLKEKTLALSLSAKGNELIDDSFSANPASSKADLELAISRQNSLPMRNLVVFTGLVDLHKESSRIHAELGELLAKLDAEVIIINEIYGRETLAGVAPKQQHKFTITSNRDQIRQKLNIVFTDSTEPLRVFIIGRIPSEIAKIINELL